ncbi:leucine-rich repeat-containing protein 46 [Ambystoma mexicanum]|uniref:leucine-rich repeat-containing protein 46 n=1 Tax=Ambystoma mexicanum TaxID=8296 RepID=UPI0037E96596
MTGDIGRKPQDKAPCITIALLAKRNLDPPLEVLTPESMSKALQSLHTVRLDREGLSVIENLESVQAIHSLYLQQNKIKMINNLSTLLNLRFLTLAGNQIQKLENLCALQSLQFLDLSDNQIETLDTGELPTSLVVLRLTGNPCTNNKGYWERVHKALPKLRDLDGGPIADHDDTELKEEGVSDSDSSDGDLEFLSPLSKNKGFFVDVHQDLFGRSEKRRRNALREHELRIEEALELPSPLWASVYSKPTLEMTLQPKKDAQQQPGVTSSNSKCAAASKQQKSEPTAMPTPMKHGLTKAAGTRENPGKVSPSIATGKASVSPAAGKPAMSQTSGKTTLSTAVGKTSLSSDAGKTSQSLASVNVPATGLRKISSSPISGKVSSGVLGKAFQSPISKKDPPSSAVEKVPTTATKGKNASSPALSSAKERSFQTPTRTSVTKPISAQKASRGPK